MTSAVLTAAPMRVKVGLRVFWIAWAASLLAGLYPELSYLYDRMEALKDENPFQANTFIGLLLAALFLMLTPKFIGSTVAAVMLLFIARRKRWARWVLFFSLMVSGIFLVPNVIAVFVNLSGRRYIWVVSIHCLAYAAMVAALVQFFSSDASAWFKLKPSSLDSSRPKHDVA